VDRIARLPETVVNQIAAGEVVERPASVVKELLENAIDAGAHRISVEITGGGLERIKITDDGSGMSAADARLALERHATSKLKVLEDLDALGTLGFRGEAVPSIASVSRFTLTTCEHGAAEGTRIEVHGGKIISEASIGAPAGTTIDVKDLFFNVPARKKFMKRAETESSHVHDAVVRLALARPEISIRLSHNGRVVLDVPAASAADPRGRLGRILGTEVSAHLYPLRVEGPSGDIVVTGWVAAPELSERTTRGLYTFVNGRYVRDRTVQHAVQEGYRTLLERGRYPLVIVAIDVDPAQIDVNVHPQKIEVRFVTPGEVHRAITAVVTRTLLEQPWLERRPPAQASVLDVLNEARSGLGPAQPPGAPAYAPQPAYSPPPTYASPSGYGGGIARESSRPGVRDGGRTGPGPIFPRSVWPVAPEPPDRLRFATLEPVGQIMATYLVCQAPDRMVVIDQHAAHERIAFARMRAQRRTGRVASQPLLVPHSVSLDAARAATARDRLDELLELGFEIEPFGGDTWAIKSIPVALGMVDVARVLGDVLDELRDLELGRAPVDDAADAVLSCAACHTVVRAGDKLGKDEIKALLVQMDEIDFGASCPHGRPVFVEFSARELANMFHRT